jgi:5-methylcytosine-specific restriction endonuclease McrA
MARDAEREREWLEREREQRALWRQHYDVYLRSPTWRQKRALVMRRAAGLCEGCGARRATQVHHRKYPRGCCPGSTEWIAAEKLFDLIAICDRCHNDVHLA